MKKLIGKKEMEDALKRLDKLTQDEARMAAAEILKLTHIVMNGTSTAYYFFFFLNQFVFRLQVRDQRRSRYRTDAFMSPCKLRCPLTMSGSTSSLEK